jgi:hypothetical protein
MDCGYYNKNPHFQSLYFCFFLIFSSSTKSFSSSSNFDEKLFDKMKMKNNICFNYVVATANSTNSYEFFNFEEMEKGVGCLMDPIIGVWDILQTCNQFQYCSKY